MRIQWSEKAWEEYTDWQSQDKKTLKRINALVKDIDRNGYTGIGKPEQLSGNLSGWHSRRIDDTNRIVYCIENGVIVIVQCKGHYGDK